MEVGAAGGRETGRGPCTVKERHLLFAGGTAGDAVLEGCLTDVRLACVCMSCSLRGCHGGAWLSGSLLTILFIEQHGE